MCEAILTAKKKPPDAYKHHKVATRKVSVLVLSKKRSAKQLLTLILSAVLTAVEAMDSALSIWEVKGCTGKPLSPSMDLLRMDWSLNVRGRDPKLDTLGMPALA